MFGRDADARRSTRRSGTLIETGSLI